MYSDFAAAAETVLAIVQEHNMHVSFCAQWGVDLAELDSTPESPACTAYGAYIMDVGLQGTFEVPFSSGSSKFIFTCVKEMRRAFWWRSRHACLVMAKLAYGFSARQGDPKAWFMSRTIRSEGG